MKPDRLERYTVFSQQVAKKAKRSFFSSLPLVLLFENVFCSLNGQR